MGALPGMPQPQNAVSPSQAELLRLLRSQGKKVVQAGTIWNIDNKLAYWYGSGRYKFSLSCGGKSGSLKGSPESNCEQICKLLAEV